MMERRNAVGVGQVPLPPPPDATPEEKLDYIANQLYRLVDIGEQLINKSPILATLPITPLGITEIVKHAGMKGQATYPFYNISWLCPAGVITDMAFSMPLGKTGTDREKMLYSDFYDINVTLDVFLNNILLTTFGCAMTAPAHVQWGEFWEKHETDMMLFRITNNTATNAIVTLSGWSELLEKSFFEDVYSPLMRQAYQALLELLK